MPTTTTTNQPETDVFRLPVSYPDGSTGPGAVVLGEAELDAIAARVAGLKAPIVGYEALQAALARVGVKVAVRTLMEWKQKRRLPCRKHAKSVTFYLDEVLERIGGRS